MRFGKATLRCGYLALALIAASCDQRAEQASPILKMATPIPVRTPSDAFRDLAPDSGDVLVPPRIGLRWSYATSETDTSGSIENTGSDARGPRFRVQLVDSAGIPYVDMETVETEVQVTLPPRTPSGMYSWWVERRAGADSTVEVSRVQKFELR